MPLRPQLQPLADELRTLRKEAEDNLRGLTDAQLLWSPEDGTWSIAQVLEHLNKVHELVIPKFEAALQGAPPATADVETIRHGFFDRMFLKMMGPSAPGKIPVPPVFEPGNPTNPNRQVVGRFFSALDGVGKVIEKADRHQLKGLRVSSPVNERMKFGYAAYLEGIVVHARYHWGQIAALRANPSFPKR